MKSILPTLALTVALFLLFAWPIEAKAKIKVHFVAHSHMDAGWLRTYDDYFKMEVTPILRSVFKRLAQYPEERYTIGDIAFFRRYYNSLTAKERLRI